MGKNDTTGDERNSGASLLQRTGQDQADRLPTTESLELIEREYLLIYRCRLGYSQAKMAKAYGIHRATYSLIECGARVFIRAFLDIPVIKELTVNEKCLILRRRLGKTQAEIGEIIGLSRFSVNQMERGIVKATKLIEYWAENAG